MLENDNIDNSFKLTLARGKKQSSCSPEWMYSIGDAFVDLFATDDLPDGYATSVGYGERFRNGEFLPLFSHYPLLVYLLILGILVTICGVVYTAYRWRVGPPLYRYLNNEISKKLNMWSRMCYVLVVITCVFLLFFIAIMLTANQNIRKTKDDRAWRLKLADESINEIISNMDNVNFARSIENFNQLSSKFHRAIQKKAQPYLGESFRSEHNLDLVTYKSDINELLETFAYCNAYMLHFLDSWRYYDTNATKFARIVDTMESRKALQSVRRVRKDFANIVYKVMQQNSAFYNCYRELDALSDEMLSKHVNKNNKRLQFANTLDTNLKNVETKLEALGTNLKQRANKMYEFKENLREVSKGAGYIDLSHTLSTFGYFVSILMMLIVFLALLFMPLWYLGSKYCRKCKCIGSILPLTTAAFIFVFYVIFVLAIMYYFLHGMVAMDGICGGKRVRDSARSDIIDDCISNFVMFENDNHTSADSVYDISTSDIEAALREIENLPKRVKRSKTTRPSAAEDFKRFHVNKTIIEDIYVEMLKVSVYAPKNIEAFGLIWYDNRLSKNKALNELNCTHAIGNTMALSLHGQVANEMDKLYRTTWRVESLIQDLPTQLQANRDDTADFDGIAELSKNLRSIFNAAKEQLRRSISHTASVKLAGCKPVAQLYKALKIPACECLVPSMNLFWFGALVAICLLLLLLALILCLDKMIRRSLLNRKSRHRLNSKSLSHHSQRGRAVSRTRSSGQPSTGHSTRNNTPYSTHTGTLYSTRPSSPYSNCLDTPYFSRATIPYASRATTPYSSHPDTPYTSRPDSPHFSRPGTPYISQHVSPYASLAETPLSTGSKNNEGTPTRGTSLALKLPPENASYLMDYNRFGVEDPFVEQFTERLSRRDMLPHHLQRKQYYPRDGRRHMKDYFTFESYPEMPPKIQQSRSRERKLDKRKEPRNVWKNEAFRYPGAGGSNISTMLQFCGPRSISKTLEQRDRSQPASERISNAHHREPILIAQQSTNEALGERPTTSGAKPKMKLPPGKVGIVVCPCGCGKPSKIYGTKQDIERIKKAGRVRIAKRGEQFKDKGLRPLASVAEFKRTGEGNEDMA